jgi:two-component system response regulator GlrR
MPTVLLVDDSPVVRRVLTVRLQAAGFDVRAEPSATAARAVNPGVFACAVIDIDLLDGSGVDLANELRRQRPTLPIAFFTAGDAADGLQAARALGPVFSKPDVEGVLAWAAGRQPPPTK